MKHETKTSKVVIDNDQTAKSEDKLKKPSTHTAYTKGYMSAIHREKCHNPYKINRPTWEAWNRGRTRGDNMRLFITRDLRFVAHKSHDT